LKLFSNCEEEGRWNFSVKDAPFPLSILAVSQFTLYARTDKGSKPDFHLSMPGERALPMFNAFVKMLRDKLGRGADAVQTGAFGKYMNVDLINDGPVTIILESKEKPKLQ
jgi:D-aminoacyl-tRNA deacylase